MTGWTRIKMAFAAFFSILFKGRVPTAIQPVARAASPSQPIVAADTHDRAVQMLALLQREGRLIEAYSFACLVYYLICLAATAGVERLKRKIAR